MDLPHVLVLLLLAGIVTSLGQALYHLSSGKDNEGRMARALTVRIGLSVALFLALMIAWYLGFIRPHGGP